MRRLVFALIALLFASSVRAQGTFPGLSAADAALLAAANSAPLNSFAFDYDFQLSTNLDTFTIAANAKGSGALDRAAHAFTISVEGALKSGTTQIIPLDGEARWVDSTLYLNLGGGWQALKGAPAALADRIGEYTGLSADVDALSAWNLLGIDGLDDLLMAIAGADPSAFIAVNRESDEGRSAHFQIAADLHALFDSDAFVDAIIALGRAQGSDLMIYNRSQVAEMLRANDQAVDPATLTIDEYVGLDDRLIDKVAVNLGMEIAPEKAGFSSAPFSVSLNFSLELREQNQPQTISAPDGAVVVPELALAVPIPQAPGEGTSQYVFLGTMGENADYTPKFDLQAGDVVTVTARRLSLEYDTVLRLLSPTGDVLLENDDQETAPYLASAYDSQIEDYAVPASGTYSVQVSESRGAAGSFLLTVTIRR